MRSQAYGAIKNEESTPLNPQQSSGLAPTVAYVRRQPKDYRIGTILASVFCFFPLGLIALYFSYQVNKLYMRGDLQRSASASEKTKFILQATVVIGFLVWFGAIFGILYYRN